jgi:hypothetical protein
VSNTKHEAPHYVIFSRFLHLFCSRVMKTHKYMESIQNSRNWTYWKTPSWKTKSRMNVTITMKCEDESCSECLCLSVHCVLLTATLCSVCVSVHCLCSYRNAVFCLWTHRRSLYKWQISNRLHVQSISRRGSAWRRVMPRHAASRYSSGPRQAQLYRDAAQHGLWQTDKPKLYYADYACVCIQCCCRQIFGLRLATTSILKCTADGCCGCASVRSVLLCDHPVGSGQLQMCVT